MPFLSTLIIRLALYLWAIAIAMFIAMAGFSHSGWLALSNHLLSVGTESLLTGSALLIILGLSVLLQTIFQQVRRYFSAYASGQRRLWFNVLKRENCLKHLAGKKQQYLYFTEFKRKHLLQANNLKHTQQLSKNIQRDLKRVNTTLSTHAYQHLQKQLNGYIRQQDVESLLELQQQIIRLM
ncbi:MAG: hypothetical protein HOP02_16595 [Methylococcaceae bacterium]|nr:hypothetical protein [Methylococcaceae bacterium]